LAWVLRVAPRKLPKRAALAEKPRRDLRGFFFDCFPEETQKSLKTNAPGQLTQQARQI
jgi:hypothetical protein